MNNKILSNDDIERIEFLLSVGNSDISRAVESLTTMISSFENEEIVNTFFKAGNFGKEEQEKMIRLKEIISRELSNISETLIPATNRFLERQRQLNESGGE